ncbi:MAG: hypothetical protein HQ538_04170 [Parcubacteria group bacterium]|nr:hypothetical protein [Parcubacteria group bacterium]
MEEEKENKKGKIILAVILILLLLLSSLGIIYYFIFYEKNSSDDSSDANKESEQEEIEKVDLSQYDGKSLNITSPDGKAEGSGYIAYDIEQNSLDIEFHALLNDDLPVNGTCGGSVDGANDCDDTIRYEYAQEITSQENSDKSFGTFLYPVLCNKDVILEGDRLEEFITFYEAKTCGIDTHVREKTSTFLVRGVMWFESYEEILGLYDVVVYDASQYWIETTDSNIDYGEGGRTFELDSDSSILPENEFSKYVIEIKE